MTLTRQLLRVVAVILGGVAFLLTAGLSVVLLKGFASIERSMAEANLESMLRLYQRDLDDMDTIARDWAWWDDSCDFIATTNADFIASSFNIETIEQLGVDFLGYFHENGEIIYAVRHNRAEKRLEAVPEYLLKELSSSNALLSISHPAGGVKGLLRTPDGPLMITVRRVLHSDQTEPDGPRAVFLLARFMDSAKVAEWGRLLNLNLAVEAVRQVERFPAADERCLPAGDGSLDQPPQVWRVDRTYIRACVVLRDLKGTPVACLHMTQPREIYYRARATIFQFAGTITVVIGLALAVLFFAIHRFVVEPVTRLGAEIEEIAQRRDMTRRVALPSQKELAGLAATVNDLLAAIRSAETDLRQYAERIEKLNRCLLGFGPDAGKNIQSLVHLAGDLLGADCALYNRLEDQCLCTLADWNAPPDLPRQNVPEGHLCFDVIAGGEGRPLVIRDLQHSPYAKTDPNVRKYGLQTYIGYPVFVAGRAIASICCVYTRDVEIGDNERKLMGIVAAAVSVEEERRAAEQRLRESREEWRRTFDLVPDPVCILDEHFVIQRVNAAMLRALNLPMEKVVGRTCFDCIHESACPPQNCPNARVLKTGTEQTAELLEEKMGGEYLITCSPIRAPDGRVIGSVHLARDIRTLKEKEKQVRKLLEESDRTRKALLSILEDERRVQAALRDSEARFRDLVALLPETIFECDMNGRVTFANDYGLQQFGYTRADLERGITLKDVIIPEQHAQLEENIRKRFAGMRGTTEYLLVRSDGSLFPGAVNVAPIVRDGQPVGLRGICVDLTEQKKMEELRIAKEAAERINRAKSEFLAVMSHELRTPLHTITGFAKALGEGVYGSITQEQHEPLRHIAEAADHLMQLISDILDMSRVEIGRVELTIGEVPLRPVLNECVELTRGRDDAAELRFDLVVAPELENTTIRADGRRLRQILLNLLSNSVKFSLPGGHIRVEVTPAPGMPGHIRFAVVDEGVGVKPDELETIFAPFQRGSPPDGKWRDGTGLGLALAKELVELHGGKIWAEPGANGQGLSVFFILPLDGSGISEHRGNTA